MNDCAFYHALLHTKYELKRRGREGGRGEREGRRKGEREGGRGEREGGRKGGREGGERGREGGREREGGSITGYLC